MKRVAAPSVAWSRRLVDLTSPRGVEQVGMRAAAASTFADVMTPVVSMRPDRALPAARRTYEQRTGGDDDAPARTAHAVWRRRCAGTAHLHPCQGLGPQGFPALRYRLYMRAATSECEDATACHVEQVERHPATSRAGDLAAAMFPVSRPRREGPEVSAPGAATVRDATAQASVVPLRRKLKAHAAANEPKREAPTFEDIIRRIVREELAGALAPLLAAAQPRQRLVSVKEAAAELHVSERTLWRRMKDGSLPFTKVANCVRIDMSEVRVSQAEVERVAADALHASR